MIKIRFTNGDKCNFDFMIINKELQCMTLVVGKSCTFDVPLSMIETIEKQVGDLNLEEIEMLGAEPTKVRKTRIKLKEFKCGGESFDLTTEEDNERLEEIRETYSLFYNGNLYDSEDYVDITCLIKDE